jgi:predicted dehydrogenase
MDVVEEKAIAAAEKHGAKPYTSLDEVLADNRVDAVVLPLPHHLHCPFAVKAARAGKHVLVEKPMAINLQEAREMVSAADESGVQLMVGQSTRFRPEVWTAMQMVSDGAIGRIRQCIHRRVWFLDKLSTAWRYSSDECGGLYVPLFSSHDVDMVLWFMSGAPVRVHSLLRSFTALVDAESDGMIDIEFSGNEIATLTFSMTSHINQHSVLFIGTKGTVLIEGGKLTVNNESVDVDTSQGNFERQMREFVGAIMDDRQPIASGQEVLTTMAVLDAAKESASRSAVVDISLIGGNDSREPKAQSLVNMPRR